MSSDPVDAGLREELITTALDALLVKIGGRVERRELDTAEARPFLNKHLAALTAEWLATNGDADHAALVNRLAKHLGPELLERYELRPPPELLTGIRPEARGLAVTRLPDRPQIPLTVRRLQVGDVPRQTAREQAHHRYPDGDDDEAYADHDDEINDDLVIVVGVVGTTHRPTNHEAQNQSP